MLWQRQYGLNASFKSLFENVGLFEVKDGSFFSFFTNNEPTRNNFYIPKLIDKICCRKAVYNLAPHQLQSITCNGPITISTFQAQDDIWPIAELFRPQKEIALKIMEVIGRNPYRPNEKICPNQRLIGCHIRRTDNIHSIKNSSIEKFDSLISEISQFGRGKTKIFLATDDIEIKRKLVQTYPDLIKTYDSRLSRRSPLGIRDAVIEMWCLALCDEIWGSYWSSFTDMAALIYNRPIKIITG